MNKPEVKPDSNLEEFKKIVRKAIFLQKHEDEYFKYIPDSKWKDIFEVNFKGNFTYAKRVILNKAKEIQEIDEPRVESEKLKIHNLDKATKMMLDSIADKTPIIFITDFDNDGSLAQSIINEYLVVDEKASKHIEVHYAQILNGNANRGFTVDLVEKIIQNNNYDPNKKFLIITADNGINSIEEQKKIQSKFPESQLIVTDHHDPDDDMMIQENNKTIIFNPHYKPTEFFKKVNISGATTVGVLLKNVLRQRFSNEQLTTEYKRNMDNIQKLSKVSNLLDYVKTDPVDKPEKDYVITKFLTLQPLLNINNSITKIITGEINPEAIKSIQAKIPNLNTQLLYDEAKNIHMQNTMAKILLKIYKEKLQLELKNFRNPETLTEEEQKILEEHRNKKSNVYLETIIITALADPEYYTDYNDINPNYIEQLRPIIFGLSADDGKTAFMDQLNKKMTDVYLNIKESEKKMSEELRRGEVISKSKLENSSIIYTDKHILTVFNRKFLNKVYNDENPGFSLTLDNVDKGRVSGSFRSLYDIADILKNKKKIEKALKVKIETPGHQRAAGFIMRSLDPVKNPISAATIDSLNVLINDSIAKIKEKETKKTKDLLLTDLAAIQLIDRINQVIRGNVSHFERLTPVFKVNKDTIWTDSYTTKQYTMEEIIKDRKYGYITIDINFEGDTVIVPIELIRKIVKSNYTDYLALNYMDEGVFMVERVITEKEPKNIIDLRDKNNKSLEIIKTFEKDFQNGNFQIKLNREQIKDNPFFKYHDYGNLNFDLFEKMVIGIIDSNRVDILSVFDVEANGFANAKLMNLGSMNYEITPNSGTELDAGDFHNRLFSTQRGDEFLLSQTELKELQEITVDDLETLDDNIKKLLLVKKEIVENSSNESIQQVEAIIKYYLHPVVNNIVKTKKKVLPFAQVKNYFENNTTETVTYNREIRATMCAFLVKDDDFRVPQQMTNLTGITQEILEKYGTKTDEVDEKFSKFYEGKNVLFGAHNTSYDAKILRANTPKIYNTLKNNEIYDSALFSKEKKLAYDDVQVAYFPDINGIPKNIYFNSDILSDFNLQKFLAEGKDGYYPDRTNKKLLGIENGKFQYIDKETHDIIELDVDEQTMRDSMRFAPLPNMSIKYSVEKLSEQWMTHALLLSDEKFNIQTVDLSKPEYSSHSHLEKQFKFFQENYHFDASFKDNFTAFMEFYSSIGQPISIDLETGQDFLDRLHKEFLEINKSIQQKFSEAWMYKSILRIQEPDTKTGVTNDLIDLLQYKTALPEEKIKKILNEIVDFKNKYKIDHIIQHESHVNGPWETDVKGDIAFEDKLTISLLAQRYYNPYNHKVDKAIKEFNKASLKARLAFEKSDLLANEVAQDSYSFRQAILYNRSTLTDLVKNLQSKEKNLQSSHEQVIKLKLDKEVLNPDTNVVVIVKDSVNLTREQLEKDSKMLSFICANEQLKYSLKSKVTNDFKKENKPPKPKKPKKGEVVVEPEVLDKNDPNNTDDTPQIDVDAIVLQRRKHDHILDSNLQLLEANDEISLKYKSDLSTRYRYIEFNKRTDQMKDLIDFLIDKITPVEPNENGKEKATRRKTVNIDDIDTDGFNIVKKIVLKHIETAKKTFTPILEDKLDEVFEYLQKIESEELTTTLERALHSKTSISDFSQVCDGSFLKEIDINRQKPIQFLLENFSSLRLTNQFIENQTREYGSNNTNDIDHRIDNTTDNTINKNSRKKP